MRYKNFSLETIRWINEEIDKLHDQSIKIGELLMEEEDHTLIKALDTKLKDIEGKMNYLQSKLEFERGINQ